MDRLLALLVAVVAVLVVAGVAVRAMAPGNGDQAVAGEQPHKAASHTPSPSVSPTPSATPTQARHDVTIVAGGDVMADPHVTTALAAGKDVFTGIEAQLEGGDLAFVNLEAPLTHGGSPQTWKDVVFKADPAFAGEMKRAGIDVVTMANNHAKDQGESGLLDTIEACHDAGIKACGAGEDLGDAQTARFLTVDGLRVAFLGFTDVLPVGYPATSTTPGTSPGRSNLAAVTAAIRAADAKADYVVVAWHWNFELTTAPSSLEAGEGRAAIDAGADLVIGHHPHVLQGVQSYHGGLIAWSTGNLVFGKQSSTRAQTVLVRATLSKQRITAELMPVSIAYDGSPAPAKGTAATSILWRVKGYSAALGTKVTIADGVGRVTVAR